MKLCCKFIKKYFNSLTGETAVAVRMAVVMRRKLQFYYWKNRQTNKHKACKYDYNYKI